MSTYRWRKRERARYSRYAKATFRQDRRLNIRLSSEDLEAIQKRALVEGLPWQALIASLLHKYAQNRARSSRWGRGAMTILKDDQDKDGDVTGFLIKWRQGDKTALDALIPLVYRELRGVAGARLQGSAPGALSRRPRSFMKHTCASSISTG